MDLNNKIIIFDGCQSMSILKFAIKIHIHNNDNIIISPLCFYNLN